MQGWLGRGWDIGGLGDSGSFLTSAAFPLPWLSFRGGARQTCLLLVSLAGSGGVDSLMGFSQCFSWTVSLGAVVG